jgi:hypothetical protein
MPDVTLLCVVVRLFRTSQVALVLQVSSQASGVLYGFIVCHGAGGWRQRANASLYLSACLGYAHCKYLNDQLSALCALAYAIEPFC